MDLIQPAHDSNDAATAIALVPRRTPAVPCSNGAYYVVTEFQYHASGYQTAKTNVYKIGEFLPFFTVLGAGAGEASWENLDPSSVSWLEGTTVLLWAVPENSRTKVYTFDAMSPDQRPQHVCDLPGNCSQLKTLKLDGDHLYQVGFVAPATAVDQHATIRRQSSAEEPQGWGRLYTKLPVRWFNEYYDGSEAHRDRSIFYVVIRLGDAGCAGWVLSDSPAQPRDVLHGTDLHLPPWTPDSFVMYASGFLINAVRGPINTGSEWRHGLYRVDIAGAGQWPANPVTHVQPSGWTGMPESACVSSSGIFAAFLQWEHDNVCFDHHSIFIACLNSARPGIHIHKLVMSCFEDGNSEGNDQWNPCIASVQWAKLTDKIIYILVESSGSVEPWKVTIRDSDTAQAAWTGTATRLVRAGCVTSLLPFGTVELGGERVMITRSDFDTAWVVETVDIASTGTSVHLVDELRLPSGSGLQANHHTITYPVGVGESSYYVKAFVHTPLEQRNTSQSCPRYPVMVLIHGGPNDAHREAWSVTWNPLLWTSMGFVVIAPNISGSVGFGLPFAQCVFQHWGGRPYNDVVALLDWLALNKDSIVEGCRINTDKVLCSGYSYGGYLVNWIAGQQSLSDNRIKFRALTVHGGVFSSRGLLGSDIPLAFAYDFGGFPWEEPKDDETNSWIRWDPSRFARNWRTPMLFTHGSEDFRVPVTEALAAFQVCQHKRIPSELLILMGEAHVVRKPVNRIQWQRKMVEWSLRWVN